MQRTEAWQMIVNPSLWARDGQSSLQQPNQLKISGAWKLNGMYINHLSFHIFTFFFSLSIKDLNSKIMASTTFCGCVITSSPIRPCIHHITFSDFRKHERHMSVGSQGKKSRIKNSFPSYIMQVSDLSNARTMTLGLALLFYKYHLTNVCQTNLCLKLY